MLECLANNDCLKDGQKGVVGAKPLRGRETISGGMHWGLNVQGRKGFEGKTVTLQMTVYKRSGFTQPSTN